MLRKLLACLALLTGLAAAGAPAQAEMAGALASHLEVSATLAKPVSRTVAATRLSVSHRFDGALAEMTAPDMACPPRHPGVRVGCDRARE